MARRESIQVLDLGASDELPSASSLIALEMDDTHRTGFSGSCCRKKSIDRIFGKLKTREIEKVDKTRLSGLPRRSLAADLDMAAVRPMKESDEEDDEDDDGVVAMLDLKIGEQDPTTNSLVAIEMRDTQKTGFRGRRKKKSIDRIFGKMRKVHIVHNVNQTVAANIPRRSLASGLDLVAFRDCESDDEENEENSGQMLNLNTGTAVPDSNLLVALEMQDTKRSGFKGKSGRKDSIDRIFGKVGGVGMSHGMNQRGYRGDSRRSLVGGLSILMMEPLESDDDDE